MKEKRRRICGPSYLIGGLFHTYKEYLADYMWTSKRDYLIELVGKCEACGNNKGLVVHHKTYVRVCNEPRRDLAVVCKACHEEIHYGNTVLIDDSSNAEIKEMKQKKMEYHFREEKEEYERRKQNDRLDR